MLVSIKRVNDGETSDLHVYVGDKYVAFLDLHPDVANEIMFIFEKGAAAQGHAFEWEVGSDKTRPH